MNTGAPALRALALVLLLLGTLPALASERYGWLGVRIRDLSESETEDLSVKRGVREAYGVLIADVLKDTPAEAAGLRAGDLIVSIDGRPIVETRGLQRLVGGTPPGRDVQVVVVRDGRRREVAIRVGAMPDEAVSDRVAAEFGFLVREPSGEEAPAAAGGARLGVVGAVLERSAAARGGLAVGDRILAVNGTQTDSTEAVRRELRGVLLRQSLRLRVERRGEPHDLTLPAVERPLPTQ
jgi:serine protease Do